MKAKIIISAITILLLNTIAFAQNLCIKEEQRAQLIAQNPNFIEFEKSYFQMAKQVGNTPTTNLVTSGNKFVLMIPVVVHIVLPPGSPTVINYARVQDQIDALNQSFAANYGGVYAPIQFCLAKTPNVVWPIAGSVTEFGVRRYTNAIGSQHTADATGIANLLALTNSGSIAGSVFNNDEYLNIYVVENINGSCNSSITSYTGAGLINLAITGAVANLPVSYPSLFFQMDGIVIRSDLFGGPSTNTQMVPNSPICTDNRIFNKGRRLVHEVGHYLSLRDTWSGTGLGSPCATQSAPGCQFNGDYCCDTDPVPLTTAYYTGGALPTLCTSTPGINNYMYLATDNFVNSFTSEQVAIMTGCLNLWRPKLVSVTNLINKGIFNGCLGPQPLAEFKVNNQTTNGMFCVGSTLTFQPAVTAPINNASSFVWTMPGSSNPSTTTSSSFQSVTANYPTVGSYTITCTSSNAITSTISTFVVNITSCALNNNLKGNSNWHWGQYASLGFSSGLPIVNTGPRLALPPTIAYGGATFTFSNNQGSTIFYTDGVDIYNGANVKLNSTPMVTPCPGCYTSSTGANPTPYVFSYPPNLIKDKNAPDHQRVTAVPVPGTTTNNEFFIFIAADHMFSASTNKIYYRRVTISPFSMGPLVDLGAYPYSTSLNIIPHANGKDYWLINTIGETQGSKAVHCRLISEYGATAVPSQVNNGMIVGSWNTSQKIKCAPDNTKIAVSGGAHLYGTQVTILDFNNCNGVMSNIQGINVSTIYPYSGISFSANSQYLYGSYLGGIDQINLTTMTRTTLPGSNMPNRHGAMQLAPDNNIYMASDYTDFLADKLSSIINPNSPNPTYLHNNLHIGVLPHINNYGNNNGFNFAHSSSFPNLIDGIKPAFVPLDFTTVQTSICNEIALSVNCWGGYSYYINWGDGTNSGYIQSLPTGLTHTYTSPGNYNVTLSLFPFGYVGTPAMASTITITKNIFANTIPACSAFATAVPLSGTLTATPATSATGYSVAGVLTINGPVNFINTRLVMTSNLSEIVVMAGAVLTISNSHLFSCGQQLWKGIDVRAGGRIVVNNNSLIEDASTAITHRNLAIAPSNVQIDNAIFNRNLNGVALNNYTLAGVLPITINNSVFTSRVLGNCTGTTWPTVANLKAINTSTDVLKTPYIMQNLPVSTLVDGQFKSQNHLLLTDVGNTTGTFPTFSFNNELSVTNCIFDNASTYGILATNTNLKVLQCIFQEIAPKTQGLASSAIMALNRYYTNSPSNPPLPYGQYANFQYSLKVLDPNSFYNCAKGIRSQNYFRNEIGYNKFYSNNVLSLANAIHLECRHTSNNNIYNNSIYNNNLGILLNNNVGGKSPFNSLGYTIINSNLITDKPAGITSATLLPMQAISCTNLGVPPAGFTNAFASPSLNLQGNTLTNVVNGINITGYTGIHNHLVTETNNTITLVYDPNSAVQTGISNSKNWNIYCKSNTVTGPPLFANSAVPANNMYNLGTTNTQLKPVVSNYQFSQNTGGTFNIVTCNKSQGGCYGFEFKQAQTNMLWRPNNEMNNQHYYGLLLNNAAVIAPQLGTGNGNIDNTWNFTPSSAAALQKHTYVWNSPKPTSIGASPSRLSVRAPQNTIYFPGGATNAFNDAFPNANRYETGAGFGLASVATGTAQSCLAIPPFPTSFPPYQLLGYEATATNAFILPSYATENNYVAQKNLYNALKSDNININASGILQNFYNTCNAPSHPYRKLWDMEEAISKEDYALAQTLMNSFNTTQEIEINYKTYVDLYIKLVKDMDLGVANQSALYNLASLCPHTKGNIIYNARNLYNQLFSENYSVFQDNCDGPGLYRATAEPAVAAALFDADIYPNPTEDLLHITTNLPLDQDITIKVTDIAGKLVSQQKCKTNFNNCTISLIHANKGMYIVTITNLKNESISKKVVLQ